MNALWFKGPLKSDNAVYINKKIEKNEVINMEEFVDTLLEHNELDLSAKNSRGKLLLAVWYKYVNILLDEKRYVKYSGTDIETTEKGLKLLRYTGVKNTYFQVLRYLTEKR